MIALCVMNYGAVVATYRFVHDDNSSCSQASLNLEEAVKVHHHLFTYLLGNKGC